MKILLVASLYHPHVGGIETVITELSKQYRQKGHQVCVLTKRYPADLDCYSQIDGLDVYRVKSAKAVEDFIEVSQELIEIETDIRADCIHLIGLRKPMGAFALGLSQRWSSPLVVSAGGGELPELHDNSSYIIWEQSKDIAKNVSLLAEKNITFSNDLVNLIHQYIDKGLSVSVIPAGVDLDKISKILPTERKSKYIFSGRRLVFSKGVDITIEAFSKICNKFPEINLVIAGDGEEKVALQNLAESLGIADRTTFIGTIKWEEHISWLKSAEFTVVPSRSEGGGLINLEAQAAGCPIIGSRAAGISEYTLENESSLLFNVGDVDMCALYMDKLLSNRSLGIVMGKKGLDFVTHFSWDVISNEYLTAYEEAKSQFQKKEVLAWSEEIESVWKILDIS